MLKDHLDKLGAFFIPQLFNKGSSFTKRPLQLARYFLCVLEPLFFVIDEKMYIDIKANLLILGELNHVHIL